MSIEMTKFIHQFSTIKTPQMKNRDIEYAKQAAKIYSDSYKPSYNVWRFMKSILGVVIYGSSTVSYLPAKKRMIR